MLRPALALVVTAVCAVTVVNALGQARKETLDGVRNFTVVDATIGCAGATDAAAIPAIAARGYKTLLNLRLATEPGAAIDESRTAAEKAGLVFVHLPFNGSAPDSSVADAFIKTVTDKSRQPVFVYCGSGNRVGALWLAKRLVADKWDQARALDEARLIGLSSAPLEKFVLDYAASRKR